MPVAYSPFRPRQFTAANETNQRGVAWLVVFSVIVVVSLGCGVSSTEDSSTSKVAVSRPQVEIELPEGLVVLVDGLYSEIPAERAYGASQLAALGTGARPAAAFLVDRLRDPDWRVRRQAAEALGAVGDTLGLEPLMETLADRDGDWSVRAAAARSLGKLGDPRAVATLIAVLNDMNAHVRHMAVIALGRIGTMEAREALAVAVRSDSDGATRFSAARALRELEGVASKGESL